MSATSRPDVIVVNAPELFEVAARRCVAAIGEAIGQRGKCAVCLSGGQTPQGLYRVLARPEYASRIAWEQVDFFWGDERCVAPTHPLSNYLMAQLGLLSHVPITPAQVHRVPVELPTPAQAAAKYEEELAGYFGTSPAAGPPPRFDLLLLGMGADGHTASLFPYAKQLREQARWVVPAERPGELQRVTLTFPVLNAARQIYFLVQGDDKADAVHHVLEEKDEPQAWPARLVQPDDGRLIWFLDGAAAHRLKPA